MMKRTLRLFIVVLFVVTGFLFTDITRGQELGISVNFSVFHDNLQPYGRWTNHPKYGQIWIYKQPGFSPYSTGGHWVYTQYGWTWVSDYSWGWATFHYGRWAYEPSFGWFWVPGYEWGPAWVSWRTGGDYYGWAPLGPGLSISISTIPADRWVFVPRRHIGNPGANRYYAPRTNNVTIIKNTTVINNTNVTKVSNRNVTYVTGPKREEVERDTKTKVTVMNVNNSTKPGKEVVDNNKKTINIYKPDGDDKALNKNTDKNVEKTPNKKPPVRQELKPKSKAKPKQSHKEKPNS